MIAPVPVAAPAAPAIVADASAPVAPAAPLDPAFGSDPVMPAPPVAAPPTLAAPTPTVAAAPPITLSRADLDQRFGDFERLASDATFALAPGGGYRVTSLRPGSDLEAIGLRAGDVVLSIDGRAINTVDDAARAYAWLRLTDHFRVELLRGAERLTFRYRVAG